MPPEFPVSSIQMWHVAPTLLWPCPHRKYSTGLFFFYCSMLWSPSLASRASIKGPQHPAQCGSADSSSSSLFDMQQCLDSHASLARTLKSWQPLTESLSHQWPYIVAHLRRQCHVKNTGDAGGNTDMQTQRGALMWDQVNSEREDRLLTGMCAISPKLTGWK